MFEMNFWLHNAYSFLILMDNFWMNCKWDFDAAGIYLIFFPKYSIFQMQEWCLDIFCIKKQYLLGLMFTLQITYHEYFK